MSSVSKKIFEEKKQIRELEIKILKELTNVSCPKISKNLINVINENVNKLDENSQIQLRCALKSFLSNFPEEDILSLPNPDKTIVDLFNTKKILGSGFFGTTVLVGIEDSKPFTVMKFSGYKFSSVHELVAGLIINSLRDEIPNYVYTYGGIICSNPTNFNTLENLCDNDVEEDLKVIVFSEYIPGLSLGDFLYSKTDSLKDNKTNNFKYIFNIITQVIYSTITAYQKLDFLQNDLHSGNIIVRDIDNPIILKYKINTGEGYSEFENFECETNHISVILDFGLSKYNYKKQDIGPLMTNNIKNNLANLLVSLSYFFQPVYRSYIEKLIENLFHFSIGEFLKRWFNILQISDSDIEEFFPPSVPPKIEDPYKTLFNPQNIQDHYKNFIF